MPRVKILARLKTPILAEVTKTEDGSWIAEFAGINGYPQRYKLLPGSRVIKEHKVKGYTGIPLKEVFWHPDCMAMQVIHEAWTALHGRDEAVEWAKIRYRAQRSFRSDPEKWVCDLVQKAA